MHNYLKSATINAKLFFILSDVNLISSTLKKENLSITSKFYMLKYLYNYFHSFILIYKNNK